MGSVWWGMCGGKCVREMWVRCEGWIRDGGSEQECVTVYVGRGGREGGEGEGTNPVLFHPSFLCQVHFSQHKDSPVSWGEEWLVNTLIAGTYSLNRNIVIRRGESEGGKRRGEESGREREGKGEERRE